MEVWWARPSTENENGLHFSATSAALLFFSFFFFMGLYGHRAGIMKQTLFQLQFIKEAENSCSRRVRKQEGGGVSGGRWSRGRMFHWGSLLNRPSRPRDKPVSQETGLNWYIHVLFAFNDSIGLNGCFILFRGALGPPLWSSRNNTETVLMVVACFMV